MSFLMHLMHFDVVRLFADWLAPGGGYYINPETGKITQAGRAVDPNRNWIYTNPDPHLHCNFYMQGVFEKLKFIHSTCLNCYKVVVMMHTVEQLFDMAQWQQEWTAEHKNTDRFCKCGIEQRDYTLHRYGAYFYCQGKTLGRLRHGQVYREMQNLFGKENVSDVQGSYKQGKIEVILKRYCTEYELAFGPSKDYRPPAQAAEMEKVLADAFHLEKMCPPQPAYLINHIMFQWLTWAWAQGDVTATKYNAGEPLYTPPVVYHEVQTKGGDNG